MTSEQEECEHDYEEVSSNSDYDECTKCGHRYWLDYDEMRYRNLSHKPSY